MFGGQPEFGLEAEIRPVAVRFCLGRTCALALFGMILGMAVRVGCHFTIVGDTCKRLIRGIP
jgi:hypothetical protein